MASNGGQHGEERTVPKIPNHLLEHFLQYFTTFHNDTDDFTKPHLRHSIASAYPLFVAIYGAIVVAGAASNVAVIVVIMRRRLYHDPTYFFIVNLALSDIVKCLVVLPATLAVLLIQNWIFGRFLCYFIPMMQDIPIHASMLTFVAIAVDRYRLIAHSAMSSRLPRFVGALVVWILAIFVVLPYIFYIRFFDFEAILGPQVAGAVLCTVNVEDDIEEYVRTMFICLYVLPLSIIAFLFIRIDGELKTRDCPLSTATGLFEMSSTTDERSTTGTDITMATSSTKDQPPARDSCDSTVAVTLHSVQLEASNVTANHNIPWVDDDFDVYKEKRNQKYLTAMTTLFALCLCPLKILGLAKHVTFETSDNTGHFDVAFITIVWIGFLSTCTTPVLFASWRMSRSTKERLRGYFQVSERGRHSSCASVIERRLYKNGHSNDGYLHSTTSCSSVDNHLQPQPHHHTTNVAVRLTTKTPRDVEGESASPTKRKSENLRNQGHQSKNKSHSRHDGPL